MSRSITPLGHHPIASGLAKIERLRLEGSKPAAESEARALLERHPDSAALLNCLALMLLDEGNLDEAETLLSKAISFAPREAALRNNLGSVLYRKASLEDAAKSFRKALELAPGYAEACHNLGIALRELDRPAEALAAQRRAVTLKENYVEALAQTGALLIETGEHKSALDPLDRAVAANPRYYDAHYYRGLALAALKRDADAIASLGTAASLRPGRHEAWHALGNALVRAGRDEEALKAYGKAIEARPDFLPAHQQYNDLAWTLGRTDLHLAPFAFARARQGDNPDLLLSEAEERLRLGQNSAAEDLLRRGINLSPARADMSNALGRALRMQARYADAIACFTRARELEPTSTAHVGQLAISFLQDKQPGPAREVLETALANSHADPLLLAHLALAMRELGDARLGELVDVERLVGTFALPTPPGYRDTAEFNRRLAEELLSLHTRKVEPSNQTLRGGTQTPGALFSHESPAIVALREQIATAVGTYIRGLPEGTAHPFLSRKNEKFDFTGSWSCRLRPNGFHTNHIHSEGWISSAYYVALPEAVNDDVHRQGWLKFGQSNLGLGERDAPSLYVKPSVGKLVLFPSYFWHGTEPFSSNDMRLTVAFDVVPEAGR